MLAIFVAVSAGDFLGQGIISIEGVVVLNVDGFVAPCGVVLAIFCFSMNSASASAVSLEGENLWMLKSLPIPPHRVLLAKCVPHILINAPISSVCGLILAVSFGVDTPYYLFYILTPFTVNLLFAIVGVLINVAFPKFNFTNEIQVIKQSLAVSLSLLFNFVVTVLLAVVAVFGALKEFGLVTSILSLAAVIILNLIAYFLLVGPAARRFSGLLP